VGGLSELWLPLMVNSLKPDVVQYCVPDCSAADAGAWNALLLFWWDRGRAVLLALALVTLALVLAQDLRSGRWSRPAILTLAWSVAGLAVPVPPPLWMELVVLAGWIGLLGLRLRRSADPPPDSV